MSDSLIDRLHRASFGDPVYVDPLTQQLLREAQEALEVRREIRIQRVHNHVKAFAQAEVEKRIASKADATEYQKLVSVQTYLWGQIEGELS